MESTNKPKKTQEQLLAERYGKGYSFGKKMQSGLRMPDPDEIYTLKELTEKLIKKYPNLYIDENGIVKRKSDS